MDIVVSQEHGRVPVTVFRIKGAIDVASYEQFQTAAQKAFAGGAQNLLLDLSEVNYISSAGLRALHYVFTLLRADSPAESDEAMSKGLRDGAFKSPHLKLLNPSPVALKVLSTAGFDMFLEIHRDLESAVASF
jgi:hypothetical protein